MKNPPECLSLSTHQHGFQPFKPPDSSQSWIEPSLITTAKAGLKKYTILKDCVDVLNQRINSAINNRNHLEDENFESTSTQTSKTKSRLKWMRIIIFCLFFLFSILLGLSQVRKKQIFFFYEREQKHTSIKA
jgi:hypothetical protein